MTDIEDDSYAHQKYSCSHAGTLAGDKALSDAIHIAKITGATINILHVIEPLSEPPKFVFTSTERREIQSELKDTINAIKKDIEDELKNRIKICKSKSINANYKVTTGTPEDEIMKFAKTHNIDLTIMAKRRKIPGIKGFLQLGSVSRKILEVSKRPVLIVEPHNQSRLASYYHHNSCSPCNIVFSLVNWNLFFLFTDYLFAISEIYKIQITWTKNKDLFRVWVAF